jgi:hypothetical protein
MKKLIFVLALAALLLPLASAYNQTELSAFADGVIAACDPAAKWNVTGSTMIVYRQATDSELDDFDYAVMKAKDLAIAANTIARHFPTEFNESSGFLMVGSIPNVMVTIFPSASESASAASQTQSLSDQMADAEHNIKSAQEFADKALTEADELIAKNNEADEAAIERITGSSEITT